MFIIKKIYNNNENKNINLYLFLFCLVILFYTSIYILSFIKVVNFWSFSQSFISYTEGFIKRGMFGTIMLFFENAFGIKINLDDVGKIVTIQDAVTYIEKRLSIYEQLEDPLF